MSMPRVAPAVPSDSDLLCEGCGYILNGLPDDGRCPECGKAVAESTAPAVRTAPQWESSRGGGFWKTTRAVLFHTTDFYRATTTRAADLARSKWFANIHWIFSAVLLAIGTHIHADRHVGSLPARLSMTSLWIAPLTVLVVYLFIRLTNVAAAKLTAWEASYRGLRLPYSVVRRALNYHAAHYTPVALVAFATIVVFDWMIATGIASYQGVVLYLYTLSGEVILAAIYLSWTYWIAMRNIMFANR